MNTDENKKIMAQNIKKYMARKGVNNQQLCDALGFKYTTFMDWIKGVTYPRIGKVEAMAQYFGCEKSDLIEDKTSSTDFLASVDFSHLKRIPILGRIAAGLPLYAEEQIEGYTFTDLNGGAEYFSLRVEGDSMNAIGINDGYFIIVRRQDIVENGEVAVVMVGDENATVKRVYATETTVTLMPQSTNPIHQPQIYDLSKTSIKVLGKVVKVEFSI